MPSILDLAAQNLLTPMVLFFVLGLAAAAVRSDLSIPESIAKFLALYLMMAIGFKGGVEVAKSGLSQTLFLSMAAGILLSALIPILAYILLRTTSKLSAIDASAVSAHYGSISIVTLIAATQNVTSAALPYEGYIVAVAAAMETPAIITALLLARRSGAAPDTQSSLKSVLHETAFNGSVIILIGSFAIGLITGSKGLAMIAPFIIDPFRGFLCLFLLDMGLVAGRGLREGRKYLSPSVIAFGLYMPLISAVLAAVIASSIGLSIGGSALFITLAASASYIAVPAAMRLALPEARPAIYLSLSLGVTFPFNLTLGIPLYLWLAKAMG